jgi:hypothetical protein
MKRRAINALFWIAIAIGVIALVVVLEPKCEPGYVAVQGYGIGFHPYRCIKGYQP